MTPDLELPEEPNPMGAFNGLEWMHYAQSLRSLARKLKGRIQLMEITENTKLVEAERKLAEAERQLENERQKVAGCSTAAIGYWKEGDSLHPDYECAAIHDVAKLYQRMVGAESRAGKDGEDAGRYRWLREATGPNPDVSVWIGRASNGVLVPRKSEDLDAAIDAARKEGK